jgi:hypothetical protein
MKPITPRVGQIVRRIGKQDKWEVWGVDGDSVALMNYSQTKTLSKRIPRKAFVRNWEAD